MSELVKDRTFTQKINGYRDILRYHLGQTKDHAKHDFDSFIDLKKDIEKYKSFDNSKLRLLDIGCGQRYPNTLLFANLINCEPTGIDIDITGPGLVKYIKMIKKNGWERSIKSGVREIFFDPIYFKTLENAAHKKLSKRNLNIYDHNSAKLPFADNYFDIVISNAVFEHIENIPEALNELARIGKPKAVFHILIHLYTSLSGGHNLNWGHPDKHIPKDVPAWDHLRDNKCPTHIYLNKLRENEYRKYFEQFTNILEWKNGLFEGEDLLNESIKHELSDYTVEELLKRYIIVICQPK